MVGDWILWRRAHKLTDEPLPRCRQSHLIVTRALISYEKIHSIIIISLLFTCPSILKMTQKRVYLQWQTTIPLCNKVLLGSRKCKVSRATGASIDISELPGLSMLLSWPRLECGSGTRDSFVDCQRHHDHCGNGRPDPLDIVAPPLSPPRIAIRLVVRLCWNNNNQHRKLSCTPSCKNWPRIYEKLTGKFILVIGIVYSTMGARVVVDSIRFLCAHLSRGGAAPGKFRQVFVYSDNKLTSFSSSGSSICSISNMSMIDSSASSNNCPS